MAHVAPLPDEALDAFAADLDPVRERMGFVPNSMKTMARKPDLLRAFAGLGRAVMGPGCSLPPDLVQMIAHICSAAAGCRYCQAHTGHVAERRGASAEKIAQVWSYETSDLFTPAERAALALAQAAAEVPNRVEAAHFEAARAHFSEDQLVEIVAVVSLFGWLNRWNDTMATDLEDSPLAFAQAALAGVGWEVGKHAGTAGGE